MRQRALGRTGFSVNELGCGTGGFVQTLRLGGRLTGHGDADEATARRTLEAALAAGITLFDTSDWFGLGHAERVLGHVLKDQREDAFIIAKGGLVPDGVTHATSDFSKEHLLCACARSLRRINVDRVDAYLLHEPQPTDVNEETWRALDEVKARGWASTVGAAVSDTHFAERLVADGRVDVLMVPLNLVNQRAARKLLEAAHQAGVGVLARSPFAGGLLSDRRGAIPRYPSDDHRSERWTEGYVAHAASIGNLARAIGGEIPLPELALRWALTHEVASVVCGFRRPDDVEAAVRAVEAGRLPMDMFARLRNPA